MRANGHSLFDLVGRPEGEELARFEARADEFRAGVDDRPGADP